MHVRNLSGLGAVPCGDSKTFVLHANNTIASPCSREFLGEFQGLQRAINAYIAADGLDIGPVTVDGNLGPQTSAAGQAVFADGLIKQIPGWPTQSPTTVSFLASNASRYTAAYASAAGVEDDKTADVASASQKTVTDSKGVTVPIDQARKGSGGGVFLLAALAGLAAFKITGKKRKRKGRR